MDDKKKTRRCHDSLNAQVLCKDRLPDLNEVVTVTGFDTWGEFEMKASRKPYKRPQKGGRTWRWVNERGEPLSRKELPELWTPNHDYTDTEFAELLGRTIVGIQRKKHKLGLTGENNDNDRIS